MAMLHGSDQLLSGAGDVLGRRAYVRARSSWCLFTTTSAGLWFPTSYASPVQSAKQYVSPSARIPLAHLWC
ncbi:hypothetical protein NDU88_007494 [Pleurodeles waltl]|uniref:Uncharacterized protein n=1 Tax=Pleurodeles waltl TaxID=8319 RepID=A0AAV7N4F6_PLEWA|nr:hypothetical protein NDU88_007494 [Pleurodeles waltl]